MKIWLRRTLAAVLVLAALLSIGFKTFEHRIGAAMFNRAVTANFGRDVTAELPDGLHLIVCGAGAPLPDPVRAGPCHAVVAGDQVFVVDIGSGAARNLGMMGIPIGEIDAVFLTHFHSDHIDGLGELLTLRWAASGRDAPTPIYGPEGVDRVVDGFNAAYALDRGYRIDHHGADIMPAAGHGGAARPFNGGGVVYEKDGATITAFNVAHDPVVPAVGYRFDYGGRSLVISGDTSATDTIVEMAKGVDLLIHDALNPVMVAQMQAAAEAGGNARLVKILSDIPDYHASPVEIARLAEEAGVDQVVLTHIVPALPVRLLEATFTRGMKRHYKGKITVARDGLTISLPVDRERPGS